MLMANVARSASDTTHSQPPTDRVCSTDWVINKYWEEYLLLDRNNVLFANILPQITRTRRYSRGSEVMSHPVGRIIHRRNEWLNQKANLPLGRFLQINDERGQFPNFTFRFVPYGESIISSDSNSVYRLGTIGEVWARPSPDFQVHFRARVENHGELYSQFSGRKWQEDVTGWIDNAALYFHKNGFFGSAGRSFLVWGPEQRDALLLSDNSSAFDRLWLGYEHRAFRFDYIIARVDDVKYHDSTLVRYFSAHRLSFRKTGKFELGLSEVALYGGYNRPIEWHYLNPFVPYYWEQWNRSTDDNMFIGVDFAVYWPRQSRLFGELMIDDFQIDFSSEPHQVGYKLGFDALEPLGAKRLFTKMSYTRVNTTVYGQNKPQNLYLHYGQSIGYFGGNDQDRWLALLRYHVSNNFDLECEFQYNRRGEGRIEQHAAPGVPYGVRFPSGVVEKSPSVKLVLRFFDSHLVAGSIAASYAHFQNYHHQCGVNKDQIGVDLFLSYFLQGLID